MGKKYGRNETLIVAPNPADIEVIKIHKRFFLVCKSVKPSSMATIAMLAEITLMCVNPPGITLDMSKKRPPESSAALRAHPSVCPASTNTPGKTRMTQTLAGIAEKKEINLQFIIGLPEATTSAKNMHQW